ncbi:MAG: leucyl aminopeptidase [Chlorobi bacterium]|nr:leucyl aminopeptidase [Chlorobiota bacterium]MCI0715430.1 leucyl aminopeptidase [Chlorobiota bacterium]
MKIKFEVKKIKDIRAEVVTSVTFEDSSDQKLQWLNTLYKGSLEPLMETKDFKGSVNQTIVTYVGGETKSKRLQVLGLGNSKEISLEKLRIAYASASKKLNALKLTSVAFEIPDLSFIKSIINHSHSDILQAICEGVFLSQYTTKKYVSKNDFAPFDEIVFFTDSPKYTKEAADAVKNTRIISDAVLMARELENEPSNMLTPEKFAEFVKKSSVKAGYNVTVFDEKKIYQLNMGGVINVSKGSNNPPRFLILQYFGSNKSEKPYVLVGKGVTFDSGGISLKPAQGMEAMKMDMGGAAAVVGAFEAVSKLKLRVNLIGLIPAVENMPSGTAYKPGDVIKSYSGITIEIDNTDAEGRVILADALDYAANYKPKAVIDICTLTGAAIICFGHLLAGLMGNDSELKKKIFNAGEKTYERVWEMPLYDDYDKLMKSDVAEIKNTGPSRQAGTIMGGIFLKKFTGDKYPWAHLDIASVGFNVAESITEYQTPGATGYGVRLFVELLKNLSH